MSKTTGKLFLINSFGTLGYIFCLILWGWTGIIYVPMLLENKHVEQLLIPTPSEPVASPQPTGEPSIVAIIFAIAVTIAILIMTVIVFIKAPKTIASTGKNITTKAAGSAVPVVTRGHKVSAAKKRQLTAGLIKLVKLLLVTLPVAIGFLGLFFTPPLPLDIIMLVSSLLAIIALIWFSLQYILARAFKASPESLV